MAVIADPYNTCMEHGGIAELFYGLRLGSHEAAVRWCPCGHMTGIAHLHWRFVLAVLQRLH